MAKRTAVTARKSKPTRAGRDRAAAGDRIKKLAADVIKLVHARQDLYVDIPTRTLSNVRFTPQKGIIELLDGKSGWLPADQLRAL